MSTVFKTRIVKIGNAQGVRIPKLFLEQIALGEEVELELQSDQIVIRPARHRVREGWDSAFRGMAAYGEDQLLDQDSLATSWDEDEWTW